MFKLILSIFLMGIIFNIIFFNKLTHNQDLNSMCKVYYKHGEPISIELHGKEINLNPSPEEQLFTNLWAQQELNTTRISDCMKIHVKE